MSYVRCDLTVIKSINPKQIRKNEIPNNAEIDLNDPLLREMLPRGIHSK